MYACIDVSIQYSRTQGRYYIREVADLILVCENTLETIKNHRYTWINLQKFAKYFSSVDFLKKLWERFGGTAGIIFVTNLRVDRLGTVHQMDRRQNTFI